FNNPTFGQSYGQGGMLGGVLPFTASPQFGSPQFGQQYFQPYAGGPQQIPQFQQANPFGQFAGQAGGGLGWPYGQGQFGQSLGQHHHSWQAHHTWQEPLLLAQLLRQYAGPISVAIASPY